MRSKLILYLLPVIIMPYIGFSQTDTLIYYPHNTTANPDSAQGQKNIIPAGYDKNTRITFNTYFTLLGSNLKQSFTRPLHMSGKNWGDLGKFALVAGTLSLADEPVQKASLNLRTHNKQLAQVSKGITDFGSSYEVYTIAALGAYGFVFKNEKLEATTLLATQSYLTGSAVETVVKIISGRTRPSVYPAGTEAEPEFLGPFAKTSKNISGKRIFSSFPSGHTTVAFAAATVFALEYRDKPIVPVIAYSAATLIGLSRITENKHWSTDVLAGAALGFLTGKQVVNNYHRYAKLKVPGRQTHTTTFNIGYFGGHLTSGFTYHFN